MYSSLTRRQVSTVQGIQDEWERDKNEERMSVDEKDLLLLPLKGFCVQSSCLPPHSPRVYVSAIDKHISSPSFPKSGTVSS